MTIAMTFLTIAVTAVLTSLLSLAVFLRFWAKHYWGKMSEVQRRLGLLEEALISQVMEEPCNAIVAERVMRTYKELLESGMYNEYAMQRARELWGLSR